MYSQDGICDASARFTASKPNTEESTDCRIPKGSPLLFKKHPVLCSLRKDLSLGMRSHIGTGDRNVASGYVTGGEAFIRAPSIAPAKFSQEPISVLATIDVPRTSGISRAAALGALRKEAVWKSALDENDAEGIIFAERDEQAHGKSMSCQLPLTPRFIAPHTRSASPSKDLPKSIPSMPLSHEVIRKISPRVIDPANNCDEAFVDAFIECLAMVCSENKDRENEAYPRTDDARKMFDLFPEEIARRFSPDFLRHVLGHMNLSRHSLCAALVYMDRAHALSGNAMVVCNKNVNVMAMSACIIALRMIEREGYSDDIIAMISGMKSAKAVRQTVAFCLSKIDGDAEVTQAETRPYEELLDRMCTTPSVALKFVEHLQIVNRNRVLKLYYPLCAIKQ
jgi:hypothetical protein